MPLQIKHFGKVHNGRLIYNNVQLYNANLLQLEGHEVEFMVKKRTRKTTLSQYAYYRGCILPSCYHSEDFGHFDKSDDIHDYYFAPMFLSVKKMFKDNNGKNIEATKIISMTDMTSTETSSFIEKVLIHCQTELNLHILSPEEYYNNHYK